MKEKLEISQKKLVEFYETLLKGENKNIDDQKKFLLQLITTKIDQIDTKEIKNEKYFKNFKISILIISSTLSFILGMKDFIVPLKNDITLFLSVIISLLTGLLTFLLPWLVSRPDIVRKQRFDCFL
jgi:hypothetical protein